MVVVMQVMLIRRLPPCKCRPLRLWEFNPEGPRILQHFMGMTPLEMYKLFFGSQEARPELTEDAGLSCNRPDTQVSSSESGHTVCLPFDDSPYDQLPSKQEWIAEAKLIWCPPPSQRPRRIPCWSGCWRLHLQRKAKGKAGKLLPRLRRLLKEGGSRIPPSKGRRGLPPRTRGQKPLNGGRNLRQRVLRPGRPRPHSLP